MNDYTQVFGGSPITPSENSYESFTLSADTTLVWPIEGGDGPFACETTDVNPTLGGLKAYMPNAMRVSTGEGCVFNNVGANSFQVVDAGGNAIVTISPTQAFFVYLISNTTANGTWRAVQFGTGTSLAQAAALAGNGLVAVSGQLQQSMPISIKSADYTLGQTDQAKVIMWTGGAGTLTVPAVSGLSNDFYVGVKNAGSGTLVISPTGSADIDGNASINLAPNDACYLFHDGTDVWTFGLGQEATFTFNTTSIDVSGSGNYTLSSAQQDQISYTLTGTLTGNRNIIVPNTVQQYWIRNQTSGSYDLTVKTAAGTGYVVTQTGSAVLFCDGTNVYNATSVNAPSALPVPVSEGGTGATNASSARSNLGATSIGDALFTAANQASARSAIGVADINDAIAYAVALG